MITTISSIKNYLYPFNEHHKTNSGENSFDHEVTENPI